MKSTPAQRTWQALEQQAKAKKLMVQQPAVDELLFQLNVAQVPMPETEFRFHHDRRWRFDLAWPVLSINVIWEPRRLAVEVDGGLFIQGRHSRGAQREKDYERDAEAMRRGWRVLRVSPRHVRNGSALRWIQELLK